MATLYGANVVRDGLVLHLDAANVKSYPGSGTTWYDLSGNNRHITFYSSGGTTYDSLSPSAPNTTIENVRQFNFDGVNDWGYFNDQFVLPSSCTVSAWVKLTDSGVNGLFSHCSGGPVGVRFGITSGKLQYYYYSGGWLEKNSISTVNDGNWKYITFAKNTTELKMYINSVLDSTYTVPEQSFNMRCIGSGWGPCNSDSYGAGTDNYSQVFAGTIGEFITYSKQLSVEEIQQNFNATRGRFGI